MRLGRSAKGRNEVNMKTLLKLEELGLFALSIYLFSSLPYDGWLFPAIILAPDLSMAGYLFGSRAGSVTYNVAHHRGVAAGLWIVGAVLEQPLLSLAGAILLGHSSLDRALGYGLKHADSFRHTHLGWIGQPAKMEQGR